MSKSFNNYVCIIQELSSERQTDKQNLLVELSRARTSLIKLEGEAKHKRTEMEAFMKHRRRRVEDIKMYQVTNTFASFWGK